MKPQKYFYNHQLTPHNPSPSHRLAPSSRFSDMFPARFSLRLLPLALLGMGLLTLPSPSLAQQSITVNSDVSHFVCGNGEASNNGYCAPLDPNLKNPDGNTVTLSDHTADSVWGGYEWVDTKDSAASNNQVTITNSTLGTDPLSLDVLVIGGEATSSNGNKATTNQNKVAVTSSRVYGLVYGGFANSDTGTTTANLNEVTVTGGPVGGSVWGGFAYSTTGTSAANQNNVTVTNITTGLSYAGEVVGGEAFSNDSDAIANQNTVTVTNGTTDDDVYGGFAETHNGNATASNNTVTVKATSAVAGLVIGGNAEGHGNNGDKFAIANENTVNVTESTVTDHVLGGFARSDGGRAYAKNNIVEMSNSTVDNGACSGGQCSIIGGIAETLTGKTEAEGNTVTLTNVTANEAIGGHSDAKGNFTMLTASGNVVTITGGKFEDIEGGMVQIDPTLVGASTGKTVYANSNVVNIYGNAEIDDVRGGRFDNDRTSWTPATLDIFSNNTLNLYSASSILGAVENFEYVNFNYSGNAMISILDTEPTDNEANSSGVVLDTRGNDVTLNAWVTGAGTLTKSGQGALTLSGTSNNWSGGGTYLNGGTLKGLSVGSLPNYTAYYFNGGTLDLNGNNLVMSRLEGTGTIEHAANLTVDQSVDTTYSGGITFVGSELEKKGPGTLTLLNTGVIDLHDGNLILTEGALNLGEGSSVLTTGMVDGGDNTTLSLDKDAQVTAGTINVGNNATLSLYMGNDPSITATTNLTIGTNATLDIIGGIDTGNNTLLIDSSNITGNFANTNLAGVAVGSANTPSLDRFADITVQNTTDGVEITTGGYAWNKASSDAHGTFKVVNSSYDLDFVLGDNINTNGLTFNWDGKTLTKTGDGTLILTAENTYTGVTNIQEGTLQIGNGGTAGSVADDGGVVIDDGATLAFNRSNNLSYGGTITDGSATGGTLSKEGVGTLTLSGANSGFSGTTELNQGKIYVQDRDALGTGQVKMADDTTLGFDTDNLTIGNNIALEGNVGYFDTLGKNAPMLTGDISGNGGLGKIGEGTLTLTGAGAFAGPLDILKGTVELDGPSADLSTDTLTLRGDGATFNYGNANNYAGSFTTLNVYGLGSGIVANNNGANFTNGSLHFNVPVNVQDGNTLLTVTGKAIIEGTTVFMSATSDLVNLDEGEKIELIYADQGIVGDLASNRAVAQQGLFGYNFELLTEANSLYALRAGAAALDTRSKALSEGHLAGIMLLNRGGNMVAGHGLTEVVRVGRLNRQSNRSNFFAAMDAGTGRYKTGSHVDMDSVSLMAGAAVSAGNADFGAFLEYGNGSYDTYNKFANAAKVKGDGKTRYWGLGLLGRANIAESGSGTTYLEGSIRAGKTKNDFRADVVTTNVGKERFNTSAGYVSLHGGAGYRWTLNETSALNLYGQFFHTREGGDSTRLKNSANERVRFAAVTSNRIRLGGRYEWTLANVTPYIGLAYEHEFDGKVKATVDGVRVDRPDMEGSSGILEGGVSIKPTASLPLTIDLGLQGYAGKQRGATGSLRIKYDF